MMIKEVKEASLQGDPDLRGELAFLARGCDFVLPSRFKKRLKSFQQQQLQPKPEKKPGTPPPAAASPPPTPCLPSPPPAPVIITPPPSAVNIPRFYYPRGLPALCPAANHDATIAAIETAFAEFEEEKADIYEMGKIAKVCGCPLYWKAPMFYAAGGERTGFVSVHSFIATWRKLLHSCHDDSSRFIYLLTKPGLNYLEQEDFIPLLQDIVDTHPGLTFLKDAPEFHSRYITTKERVHQCEPGELRNVPLKSRLCCTGVQRSLSASAYRDITETKLPTVTFAAETLACRMSILRPFQSIVGQLTHSSMRHLELWEVDLPENSC
ncbi:hypothetical protein ILYODFUR_004212 [Ilyodon furcidens]|uniref:Uncharacterized protein n=1 Tax=Ilyodon furcidens TaxID=33524 RepID=A0ABV0VBL4_9TELE